MRASEGKLGRIFMIRLENDDRPTASIERFAADNGILAAQVFVVADATLVGIIAPNVDGLPRLRLPEPETPGRDDPAWTEGEVIVQELVGINFRRILDPKLGRETLAIMPSTKTRVMEKAAPAPEESGPGAIPVYLFNAEFN
ncbi:MAG: DNA-binding protein [Planctomycetes bacterium]|nr:DNA-binding protein [Planctomycetota bacterium]